jgi:hypothetical protein
MNAHKVSVWDKLRKPWEHHPQNLPTVRPAASELSAIEVELRAMRARPDPVYGAAVSALSDSNRPAG